MSRSEEAKRLYEMMLATGTRKSMFARTLGMSQQSLNDYLDGTSDIKIISRVIHRKGYSVDYLYSGRGEMFFSPERFEEQFNISSNYDIDLQKQRIKDWISLNYQSIGNFRIERQVSEELIDTLYNDDVIPHELLVKLENAGCNLKWTINGEGSMFLDNTKGKKLKKIQGKK